MIVPIGKISKKHYPELDISWQLKIDQIEEQAEQQFYDANQTEKDKDKFIRNFTIKTLWEEYCIEQEKNNMFCHRNKKKMLGKNIQLLRESINITCEDLANILRISAEDLQLWEKGESMPSYDTISSLSHFFQYPLDIYIQNTYYN